MHPRCGPVRCRESMTRMSRSPFTAARARRALLCTLLAIVAAVAVGSLALPAIAQDDPAPEPPVLPEVVVDEQAEEKAELVAKGAEYAQQLTLLHERSESFKTRARSAKGDELLILSQRAADTRLEYADVFSDLVENVLAQEALGLAAPELRAKIESDLARLPAQIGAYIEQAVVRLQALRAERAALPIAEQSAVQHRVARVAEWLTDLLRAYTHLVDTASAAGLDNADLRSDALRRNQEIAEGISGHLTLVASARSNAIGRLEDAPDDADVQQEIAFLDLRRTQLAHSLTVVADLIDTLDGDSSEFRQVLIQATGTLTTAVFDKEVLGGLLDEWWKESREWARMNAPIMAFRAIVFVLILCAFRLLAAIVRRILVRRLMRDEGEKSSLMLQMAEALTVRTVMLVGFLIGLSQLGVELGPLLAGLGIAGFIVGFALQDSLSNFAAGVMILVYSPFDVGDMIEAAGVKGSVNRMSLVSTTILTIDNQTLIVPNSKIWGNVIRNVTRQSQRRIDLKFRIAYTEDLERVERIFQEIVEAHPKTLNDPAPRVNLHEMGEYAMEIIVRPWVATSDYWTVYWELMRTIKLRLDAEGIAIPLPGREVHLRGEKTTIPHSPDRTAI